MGQSINVDLDYFVRSDGVMIPVAYSASPLHLGASSGTVIVFEDVSEKVAEQQRIERELDKLTWVGRTREALEHDRFVLFAQPIVSLATMKPIQNELLIRMLGAEGGVIPPLNFLPAAEEFGLIGEIDRWVVTQAAQLAAEGHRVEFNLSAKSVADSSMLRFIQRAVEAAGAPAQNLMCEITETALMHDFETADRLVRGLAELGIKVALDDFGSGYGGFAYLKRLPVACLKIDAEFVRDLAQESSSRHVVTAVVNLAEAFGLETVAEGAEDMATVDILRDLGVQNVQGFAIARPSPVEECLKA